MLLHRLPAFPIALTGFGKTPIRMVALLLVGCGLAGCPTPPEGGQSDHCAVMMRCWYAEDAFIERPEQIPVRLRDGAVLSESDIQLIRDHYSETGACWQDETLAVKCTDACIQALAANCDLALTQCLNPEGTAFADRVKAGTVESCEDEAIANEIDAGMAAAP